MKKQITPFLWFDGQAEEAAKHYARIFPKSKVTHVQKYPDGKVMTVAFSINGNAFVALNGGPQFKFNPSISFVVTCDNQRELDAVWKKLLKGGKPSRCGWLEDKYGVSWQIVPDGLGSLIRHPRAMEAMMKMVKLDVNVLKRAAKG